MIALHIQHIDSNSGQLKNVSKMVISVFLEAHHLFPVFLGLLQTYQTDENINVYLTKFGPLNRRNRYPGTLMDDTMA
jgi:hypothetical protein